ncbi:MAG: ferritin-like domain-containing protein [Bacteroidales bacterium]
MGKKALEIMDLDVKVLIRMLNEALAEEWLAYYQYWIGAEVIEGPMRGEIVPELRLHATEELGHANLLVARIIQLGGTPLLDPKDWFTNARCKYEAPSDPYVEVVLQQNVEGERCAIQRYKEIADFTNGRDHTTHQIATQILADELEHENDLEDFITDINRMKEEFKKLRL